MIQVHLFPLLPPQCPINAGDQLQVQVWNPSSTSGPSATKTVTATGQLGIFISIPGSTVIEGPYAAFSGADIVSFSEAIVSALDAQGIKISKSQVGFTIIPNSGISEQAVLELDDLLALPTDFLSLFSTDVDLIDLGLGPAELLPLDLYEECLSSSCLPSPPEIVASIANSVLTADAAAVESDVSEFCSSPEYIIGAGAALEVTVSGLTVSPSQLGARLSEISCS